MLKPRHCEVSNGKLATARSPMAQVPPSFSEASWAVKPLPCCDPAKDEKVLNLPLGFVARPEPLATFRRKMILSIPQLYCEGSVLRHYLRKSFKGFPFKIRVVSTQGQLMPLAKQSSPHWWNECDATMSHSGDLKCYKHKLINIVSN